jgi:hypothetical protein
MRRDRFERAAMHRQPARKRATSSGVAARSEIEIANATKTAMRRNMSAEATGAGSSRKHPKAGAGDD